MLAHNATDTAIATGQPGIIGGANGAGATLDNWRAGDLPYPGPFFDDFNRADGALAAPWVAVDGVVSIASNKIAVASVNPSVVYYNQTFAADQWAEADIVWVPSAAVFAPTLRINGSDLYYFWIAGSNVAINKRVGGTYSAVATAGTTVPTSFKARFEARRVNAPRLRRRCSGGVRHRHRHCLGTPRRPRHWDRWNPRQLPCREPAVHAMSDERMTP